MFPQCKYFPQNVTSLSKRAKIVILRKATEKFVRPAYRKGVAVGEATKYSQSELQRRITRVSHRCYEHGGHGGGWGGGGLLKIWWGGKGGLSQNMLEAWEELKMLSKNNCEIVAGYKPVSLQIY